MTVRSLIARELRGIAFITLTVANRLDPQPIRMVRIYQLTARQQHERTVATIARDN